MRRIIVNRGYGLWLQIVIAIILTIFSHPLLFYRLLLLNFYLQQAKLNKLTLKCCCCRSRVLYRIMKASGFSYPLKTIVGSIGLPVELDALYGNESFDFRLCLCSDNEKVREREYPLVIRQIASREKIMNELDILTSK
jgi:hypothetical protein